MGCAVEYRGISLALKSSRTLSSESSQLTMELCTELSRDRPASLQVESTCCPMGFQDDSRLCVTQPCKAAGTLPTTKPYEMLLKLYSLERVLWRAFFFKQSWFPKLGSDSSDEGIQMTLKFLLVPRSCDSTVFGCFRHLLLLNYENTIGKNSSCP